MDDLVEVVLFVFHIALYRAIVGQKKLILSLVFFIVIVNDGIFGL